MKIRFACFFGVLLFLSCSTIVEPPRVTQNATGSFLLKMSSSAIPREVYWIVAKLERPHSEPVSDSVSTESLGDSLKLSIQHIGPGIWDLTVLAKGSLGQPLYKGKETIQIESGRTTQANVFMSPIDTTGDVVIHLVWDYSLRFDGQGGEVVVPPSSILQPEVFTLEMDVRIDSLQASNPFLAETGKNQWNEADGYCVKLEDGVIQFRIASQSDLAFVIWSPFQGSPGEWFHIACTYDQDTARLYIDGVEVAKQHETSPVYYGSSGFTIGKASFNSYLGRETYLNGTIDNVRIWNLVRTKEQIQSTMNSSLKGNEAGLVGLWDCNQVPSDSILHDKTSHKNHGQINGNVAFVLP